MCAIGATLSWTELIKSIERNHMKLVNCNKSQRMKMSNQIKESGSTHPFVADIWRKHWQNIRKDYERSIRIGERKIEKVSNCSIYSRCLHVIRIVLLKMHMCVFVCCHIVEGARGETKKWNSNQQEMNNRQWFSISIFRVVHKQQLPFSWRFIGFARLFCCILCTCSVTVGAEPRDCVLNYCYSH